MLVKDHVKFLRERVAEQARWVEDHGGDVEGYIRRYGDPDRAPLDSNGNCKTLSLPGELARLAEDLRPVEGQSDCYYAPMFGCGGTAIYRADKGKLDYWQSELASWESRHYSAARAAGESQPSRDDAIVELIKAARNADDELCRASFPGLRNSKDITFASNQLRAAIAKVEATL